MADTIPLEAAVARIIHASVFAPILADIAGVTEQTPMVLNSDDSILRSALRSGRIQYEGGVFSGDFNARISGALRSIGGKLDKRTHVYKLPAATVPSWVKAEAAAYNAKVVALNKKLRDRLSEMAEKIDAAVDAHPLPANDIVGRIDTAFKPTAQALSVSPTITAESRERLAREYTENIRLKVKGFSRDAIERLRVDVEKNALEGYRSDKLAAAVGRRFSITAARAKFIAREETRLFTTKFHEQRYREAGVTFYTWSDSADERVRDDHHDLNGKRFSFDDPPIVNKATGKKGNPGDDYGCRCVPLVEIPRS